MMMSGGFLCEPKSGEIAHTNLSAQFVTSPSLYDSALFLAGIVNPTMSKNTDTADRYGVYDRGNPSTLDLTASTIVSFDEDLVRTPKLQRRFDSYKRTVMASNEVTEEHLVEAFDWASLGNVTVVDVWQSPIRKLGQNDRTVLTPPGGRPRLLCRHYTRYPLSTPSNHRPGRP